MTKILYLTDDILSSIRLQDKTMVAGEPHLSFCCLTGMKAEPLVCLQTGMVIGHEFLSQLPAGICSESFFQVQPATLLAELFLLQLLLSTGLTNGKRLFNLPVRVLFRPRLCEVLFRRNLSGVIIEIQDPEVLATLSPEQIDRLRCQLYGFREAGAGIYADDVIPQWVPELSAMALPLSGLKVSRQCFHAHCHHPVAWNDMTETEAKAGNVLVAEGIETPEQSLLAALAGFTHGQGRLWPAEAWQFSNLCRDNGNIPMSSY